MGNSDSTPNQVLLLGLSGHGKTRFLHHNSLKTGNYESEIKPSLGFNYEVLTHVDIKIGVWDLAGGTIYKPLWKKFYKNLDIHGIVFMIRLYDDAGLKAVEQQKQNERVFKNEVPDEAGNGLKKVSPTMVAIEARKELHFVMNEYALRDVFCFVIINNNSEFWPKEGKEGEGTQEQSAAMAKDKLDKLYQDCKELIKFDELPQKRKDLFVLTNIKTEFDECVEKLANFFKPKN